MLEENNSRMFQKCYPMIKLDLRNVFTRYVLKKFWKSIRKRIEILETAKNVP